MIQTPTQIRENIPGYDIELDGETFKWVARTVTPGGPTFTGSKERIIRCVAAEQGWSQEDIDDTIADAHNPARSGW